MKKHKIWLILIALCSVLSCSLFVWKYTRNGVQKLFYSSERYYYRHGEIDTGQNGLVFSNGGWWYLKEGKVNTHYIGLVPYKDGLWRVKDGTIDFSYSGFAEDDSGWWYLENGKVQTDASGLILGKIRTDVTGFVYGRNFQTPLFLSRLADATSAGWWYVQDGKVSCTDILCKEGKYWWAVQNGRVDFAYQGIAQNGNGRFFVSHGRVNFQKKGTYLQNGVTYILKKGKVKGEVSADSTRFVAHRGLSSEAPENTIKAFELAGKAGFWGCETDVRMTADGCFVLLHNKTFKRMCGLKITPGELTVEEIGQLSICSGKNLTLYQDDPKATKIAFLEDFLDVCLRYDMVPVIDIKEKSSGDESADREKLTALYQTARQQMGDGKVVFIAFDMDILKQMRRILTENYDTNVTLQYLTRDACKAELSDYLDWQIELDADYEALEARTLSHFQENGIAVNLWTVDSVYKAYELIQAGTDYITTDRRFW